MRKRYESDKDRERERFVQAVLYHKYKLELTPSWSPYDFIGSTFAGNLDTVFELKARSYKMDEVPQGKLFLTFDKYQKIVQTLVPFKNLLIMNPEGLWMGEFNDIEGSVNCPTLTIGGRYDRNDTGDVGLHVLFPTNKLTNIYTREELLKLQHAYTANRQIFSTEEVQRLLLAPDQSGDNEIGGGVPLLTGED